MALTTHYLTENELRQIGNAVKMLARVGVEAETRFHAFAYFLSRKWSKVLEYDIDRIDPILADVIDSIYRSHLADLPGQESEIPLATPWGRQHWYRADNAQMQAAEDEWLSGVAAVVRVGLATAERVIHLKIASGEGAFLQRVTFRFKSFFAPVDYRWLLGEAKKCLGEAGEYERLVQRYRRPIRNGWSGRTKKQAEYLGGTHYRLHEMTELCVKFLRHKAGVARLIAMEAERSKQELNFSYRMFMKLVDAVLHPQKISHVEARNEIQ